MDIEQQIRKSFQRYAQTIEAPAELDALVARGFVRQGNLSGRPLRTFKRVAVGTLIGAFAVTATAFAASPSFADRIYGSFVELKKKVVTVTKQEYQQAGLKFAGAQKELGEDYPAFENLAKQMVAVKVEYANKYGQIDFSVLSPETYLRVKWLYADIQPYFDRLNHIPVTRDALTTEEYDDYITAELQRETILAKAGVNPSAGPVQVMSLPVELQAEYNKAEQTIRKFEQKSRQSSKPKAELER